MRVDGFVAEAAQVLSPEDLRSHIERHLWDCYAPAPAVGLTRVECQGLAGWMAQDEVAVLVPATSDDPRLRRSLAYLAYLRVTRGVYLEPRA